MAKINILDKAGATFLIGKIKTDLASIRTALGGKVDKDGNKVLSDNNYTSTERKKLSGIDDNAQVNKLESITVNNSPIGMVDKVANIDLTSYAKTANVPTNNNQLTNGAGYQTEQDVESIVTGKGYQTSSQVESAITGKGYQTSSQVDAAITSKGYQTSSQVETAISSAVSQLPKQKRVLAETLPPSGDSNTLYLVPSSKSGDKNAHDEYIWIEDTKSFELIGSTAADMTGYVKESDIVPIGDTELETLWNTSQSK